MKIMKHDLLALLYLLSLTCTSCAGFMAIESNPAVVEAEIEGVEAIEHAFASKGATGATGSIALQPLVTNANK